MDLTPGMEAELWRRIRVGSDAGATDLLVMHYVGWAASIARSIHRRVPAYPGDHEDFVQNARIGLLEAVSRFDPERGVPFPAFAKPRIRGAVFNGLRAIMGERLSVVQAQAYDERLSSLLEEPFENPVDRVVNAILGLGTAFLLDETEAANPVAYADRLSVQRMIRGQVARLPERQRIIIEHHYLLHRPFVEIAGELGLTKGRISQLHREALTQLRNWLSEAR